MLNVYNLKIAHPELFQQISISDNLIVYYRCPQADQLVRLYNHYEEILFTLSGKKTLHIGEKSWELTSHNSLLVRKCAYVQEMFDGVDWEVLAFHFNSDFLKSAMAEFTKEFKVEELPAVPTDMILRITITPVIRANFYSLLPLFSDKSKYSVNMIERKVKELLFSILAAPENICILAYFNHIFRENKIPIWHVMESNYMFNLSLEEFARLCQRSLSTFKKDFKNHYKVSPGKWLLEKRLVYANQMLHATSVNITDVAYESGFENISHFSKVYKNQYGLSPSDHRKIQAS